MAKISYPTEKSISGPWLIDADHLTALDGLFDEYLDKFRAEVHENLRSLAERRLAERGQDHTPQQLQERIRDLQSIYGRESRSVAIYLKGGKTVTSERFADLLTLPNMNEETAVGFRSDLEVGDFRASASLRTRWSNYVIEVTPSDSTRAQELFSALENLVTEIAPSSLQQMWLKFVDSMGSLPLFLWVFAGLLIASIGVTPDAKDVYREKVNEVMRKGVNPQNQSQATELILAIVSGYTDPQNPPFRPGIKYWGYFAIGLFILAALRACPAVVIGVWKGKQKIKDWRRWIRFVWVTVPSLILTSVVWPRLLVFLGVK